jgi:hypothetical protein
LRAFQQTGTTNFATKNVELRDKKKAGRGPLLSVLHDAAQRWA